jgi:hypothetical protein
VCAPPQQLARRTFSLFTYRPNRMLLMNCTVPSALSSDCAANAKLAKLSRLPTENSSMPPSQMRLPGKCHLRGGSRVGVGGGRGASDGQPAHGDADAYQL